MACMKHFACNSMENARFKVDVVAGERALHEVYLPHFKRVATDGVAAVMSAYNSLNGHWCGDSRPLLTEILRDEWGWDGLVVTDFIMGLRDPVASVQAGCNIEMPFRQQRAQALPEAVASGELDVADADARVVETLATLLRFARVFRSSPHRSVVGCAEHRALAREAAAASMVLLHNNGLLPIDAGLLSNVAVVGPLASVPNLGDGGSSDVLHTPDPVTLLAGVEAALAGVGASVVHSDRDASVAAGAEVAVVVVGYTRHDEGEYLGDGGAVFLELAPPMDHPELGFTDPAQFEAIAAGLGDGGAVAGSSPGGDRASLRLHPDDEQLIADAAAVCDRVVVAVMAGSAVVMPWLDAVSAALMVWYPGSEGGHALADVLFGRIEPGAGCRSPSPATRPTSSTSTVTPRRPTTDCCTANGTWTPTPPTPTFPSATASATRHSRLSRPDWRATGRSSPSPTPVHAPAPRWCRSTAASPARPTSARPSAWSASPRFASTLPRAPRRQSPSTGRCSTCASAAAGCAKTCPSSTPSDSTPPPPDRSDPPLARPRDRQRLALGARRVGPD